MGESGCTCEDPDLVPCQDRNMKLPYVSGNKYCRYCRNCGRRYFCKKSFWQRAKEKFVIPFGDEDADPIPVEDYVEEADERDDNCFFCPECDTVLFGQPEECRECGAEYEW